MPPARKLIPLLGFICLFGCAKEPQPPAGCTFCKALPSEGFNTLALRTLGDPERGPELAALNRVDERLRPAEVERLIVPEGANLEQPPIYESLEAGGGEGSWLAASRLTVRGDLAGAASLLETALSEYPHQPRLRFLLGLLRFRLGEAWRAEVQLRAASYLAPTDHRPHLALALLHAARDGVCETRKELSVALALEPEDDRAWALAAILAAAEGDYREAAFLLEGYLHIGPTYGTEREIYADMLALIEVGLDPLETAWRSSRLPTTDPRDPVLDPPE